MSGKLNKARAREQSANKRENEWRKQFMLMRQQRDDLKVKIEELQKQFIVEVK
jgi:hypothetical protein